MAKKPKQKAGSKKGRSIYQAALDESQFGSLDGLSGQSPEEIVETVKAVGRSVGDKYRAGHKRVAEGLAYAYGVYATMQRFEGHQRDECLNALAGPKEHRGDGSQGKEAKLSTDPVHVMLRSMVDYGNVYSTPESARQALHRDANVLRYAWEYRVPFDGLLAFFVAEGLGVDAMSRAYVALKSQESPAGSKAGGDPGEGTKSSSVDIRSTATPKARTNDFGDRRTSISVDLPSGSDKSFVLLCNIDSEKKLTMTAITRATFDPRGQLDLHSFTRLKRAIALSGNAATTGKSGSRVAATAKESSHE